MPPKPNTYKQAPSVLHMIDTILDKGLRSKLTFYGLFQRSRVLNLRRAMPEYLAIPTTVYRSLL